ncbi:hypothetical protein F5I97DRAFT_1662973 [Phlebopus sp. FC_14]|nr:hypothetical protein F5I97DRAFT_1662973 [Phlebopus sp. FC_14]
MAAKHSPRSEVILWTLTSCAFAVVTISFLLLKSQTWTELVEGEKAYSWIEDDFPESWPLKVETVGLVPEDTAWYKVEGAEAAMQWDALFPPTSKGWVCLGPNDRPFALTMYHELHCLNRIREAIADEGNRDEHIMSTHVHHCLNYLRMMALCRADLTLEPAVYDEEGRVSVSLDRTHVCSDWTTVFDEAEKTSGKC